MKELLYNLHGKYISDRTDITDRVDFKVGRRAEVLRVIVLYKTMNLGMLLRDELWLQLDGDEG